LRFKARGGVFLVVFNQINNIIKKLIICAIFALFAFSNLAIAQADDPCPPLMAGESGTVGECRGFIIFEIESKWCDTGAEGPGDCLVPSDD
jgi:hypothetical protein